MTSSESSLPLNLSIGNPVSGWATIWPLSGFLLLGDYMLTEETIWSAHGDAILNLLHMSDTP